MRLTQRKVGLCNNDQWMAKTCNSTINRKVFFKFSKGTLSLSLMRPSHRFSNFSAPGSFWLPKKKSCRITVLFGDWIACNMSICSKTVWPIHMSLRLTQTEWWRLLEGAAGVYPQNGGPFWILDFLGSLLVKKGGPWHSKPYLNLISRGWGSFHPFQGHRVPSFTESMNLNGHRASHLLSPWQSWSMG